MEYSTYLPIYLPFFAALGAVCYRKARRSLSWNRRLMLWAAKVLTPLRYQMRSKGWANMPAQGPALLICNHVSYADAAVLQAQCPRPIRFMSLERIVNSRRLGPWLRAAEVIPVNPRKAASALKAAVRCLRAGEVVCIFPEGKLSRDGTTAAFQGGFERIAKLSGAPVIPVWLDGLWRSRLSFSPDPQKLPLWQRRRVRMTVGPALEPAMLEPATARQHLVDMGAEAFEQRPELQGNFAHLAVQRLAKTAGQPFAVDYGAGRKQMNGGLLLAVAYALSRQLKRDCAESRVGIILPPGLLGTIANLAVVLAGKVPVNLNYTLGGEALKSCLAQAGVRTMLTVDKMRETIDERFGDFPWVEHTIELRSYLQGLPRPLIVAVAAAARVLPGSLLARLLGVPRQGGHHEAALLFTSGSDSAPKGVVLSHRNLIANTLQVRDSGILPQGCKALLNLPIFHSFGFTVGIWTALTQPFYPVYVPSPLDFKMTAEAIQREGCTVLIGTPTFLRPYLKHVPAEKLASLRTVVAGAEKTPAAFHEAWEARFPHCQYFEGYGLTETSPVVSVNLPDIAPSPESPEGFTGKRAGSVGRLFTGMAARTLHPDTGEILPIGETGVLSLKGPNIFEGYLNLPEQSAAMFDEDGWLRTGDLARLDADGFLYIEGRLSRFSKIGGEMVPHGAVEVAVAQALGLPQDELPQVAIAAKQDEAKGESLVLLASIEVDMSLLRSKLQEAGLANLWIPKVLQRVEAIPTLATGKLDLKGLRKLIAEA